MYKRPTRHSSLPQPPLSFLSLLLQQAVNTWNPLSFAKTKYLRTFGLACHQLRKGPLDCVGPFFRGVIYHLHTSTLLSSGTAEARRLTLDPGLHIIHVVWPWAGYCHQWDPLFLLQEQRQQYSSHILKNVFNWYHRIWVEIKSHILRETSNTVFYQWQASNSPALNSAFQSRETKSWMLKESNRATLGIDSTCKEPLVESIFELFWLHITLHMFLLY